MGHSMATPDRYEIKTSWFGRRIVRYSCPHCGETLRSALTTAGQDDSCPICDNAFVVPGSNDLRCFTEAKQLANQNKAFLKEQLKEEARHRKARLDQQRNDALAMKERIAKERRLATSDTNETESSRTKPSRLLWRTGAGGTAAVLMLSVYILVRGADLRDKLSRCESVDVVNVRVSYGGVFGTDTVVFDVRDGGSPGARRIDPVHLLMQFTGRLDLQSVNRVVLARNGNSRFYISSTPSGAYN